MTELALNGVIYGTEFLNYKITQMCTQAGQLAMNW